MAQKMDRKPGRDQMNENGIKNIHKFLLTHNFNNTAGTLMMEAAKKGFTYFDKNSSVNDPTYLDPYEQIHISYMSGDWKRFFKLWNLLIPENVKRSRDYKVLTLNLHVHFAVWPKRVLLSHWCNENDSTKTDRGISMLSSNENDVEYKQRENFVTEIEKKMVDGMEHLREYLNTDGKELEHDAQLRPFFALPFIEDSYAEPFLSKIFEDSWLNDLTKKLYQFINSHKQDSHDTTLNEESCNLPPVDGSLEVKQKVYDMQRITNNILIIPNDRNIPVFLEENDAREQCTSFDNYKSNQKTKSTQTHINSMQFSINPLKEDIHSSIPFRNDKRIVQCTQELALTKSHLCTVHSNYEKLKLRFHKLHADYHKLISIAGELTVALENSVKGQAVDLQAMLETCIQIFPDLFSQNVRDGSQCSSTLRLNKCFSSMEPIRHFNFDIAPVSPKLLDFKKIKLHLINGNMKTKLFLLQALRRKITLGRPGERDEAIHEYIIKDLLGLHGQIASDNGKSTLPYLLVPENISMPHPLQQSAARLLNVLASFRCGRDYLSFGSTVVNVVFKCLSTTCDNEVDAFTCNMMIAMLQKLSLRKQQRIYMIENGLVEWLIQHLNAHYHVMDSYRLEYATALLMNLSLHRIAQRRASVMAPLLISMLLTLLSVDNSSVLPYVNGALNNFLSNHTINDEAKKMNVSSVLEHYRKYKTGEIRKHLDHILKIHRGESTVNTEDEDTADDDNEEFDVLENELEENDPVKNYAGELCGEALLTTCYIMSPQIIQERNKNSDVSAIKQSIIEIVPTQSKQDIFSYREPVKHNTNLVPRESSKTTVTSSTILPVVNGDETTVTEKFSSIASLNSTKGNKVIDNISHEEETEIDSEEAFLAKPKLPRTPP